MFSIEASGNDGESTYAHSATVMNAIHNMRGSPPRDSGLNLFSNVR